VRLPAAPILKVLERAAKAQGYIGPTNDIPGLEGFVEMLGLEPRTIDRARKTGTISLVMADRLAIALKLHPIIVWPEEWEAEALRRREQTAARLRRFETCRGAA
jgi:hypothetical protein